MSYQEENGNVVLRMSKEDWHLTMYALDKAIGCVPNPARHLAYKLIDLRNRLNQGNPNYTPYQVKP
jgi:hypothetical protein